LKQFVTLDLKAIHRILPMIGKSASYEVERHFSSFF